MPMSTKQRATIAALTRWSREDPKATAERGQQGLRDKFLAQARAEDPDCSEAELERRANVLYRLHFVRIRAQRTAKSKAAAG